MDKDNGAPLDELDAVTKNWCRSLGSQCETVSEILQKKPKEVSRVL